MLLVNSLEKSYGEVRVLNEISFEVRSGRSVLLLGPNGAGKTTIIRCIMSLVNFRGDIAFDGHDVKREGSRVRAKIGYMPQRLAYYEKLTVGDHTRFAARLKSVGYDETRRCLEYANLWDLRNRRVKSLSSGMRQRFGIALALLNDPPFLIFDEPTSNIDVQGQLEFQSLIRRLSAEGKTLLITTHLSGLDNLASDAIVLGSGRIVAQGSLKELLTRITATDTMYLKMSKPDVVKALEIFRALGVGEATMKEEWLVVSVRADVKGRILKSLLEGSCEIEDLIVEPRLIESEYLRLLGKS